MRVMAYGLLIGGLLLLVEAAFQEFRGITTVPYLTGGGTPVVLDGGELTRAASSENFHNAMIFHWFYAGLTITCGIILLMIIRGQDKTDPFSPDFDWKDDEDESAGTKFPKK